MIAALAFFKRVPWWVWLALALGAYHFYAVNSARQQGAKQARQEIVEANRKSMEKADEADRSVETCRGTWDRSRGRCVPDAGR